MKSKNYLKIGACELTCSMPQSQKPVKSARKSVVVARKSVVVTRCSLKRAAKNARSSKKRVSKKGRTSQRVNSSTKQYKKRRSLR